MKFITLSIRRKIRLSILLPTVLVGLLTGVTLFTHSYRVSTREARARLAEINERYRYELNAAIREVETIGNMMQGLVSKQFPPEKIRGNQKAMENHKADFAALTLNLAHTMRPTSLWAIFNPALAPGAHTVSYYDKNKDGHYKRSAQYRANEKNLDSRQMQWWTQALEHGSHWSLRYYWKDWDMEVISYSKAVYHDTTFLAVAGSDFAFKHLREDISSETLYETGYIALANNSFELIIHPRYRGKKLNELMDSQELERFIKQSRQKQKGSFTFHRIPDRQLVSYSELRNGWYLIAVVPYKEVFAGSQALIWIFLGVLLLAVALAWGISYTMGNSLTRPVFQLVEALRHASAGHIGRQVKVEGSKEIQELTRHFNQFTQSISQLMQELSHSEKQLLEARMKAEEAERLKSAFLANISHEFRTPLNAIQGVMEIKKMEQAPDSIGPFKNEDLELIQSQINRLLALLNNLIELSQLKMNELTLQYRTFNLRDMCEELRNEYAGKANSKLSFQLSPNFDYEEAWVVSDEQRLKRVLEVLLDNAFSFTEEGKVRLACEKDPDKLLFLVSDTGTGIPAEKQQAIFNHFNQANMRLSRKHQGAGIGLAIAQQILENMEGKIWLESEEGKGTRFFVSVPYQQSQRERIPRWLRAL